MNFIPEIIIIRVKSLILAITKRHFTFVSCEMPFVTIFILSMLTLQIIADTATSVLLQEEHFLYSFSVLQQ